MIEFLELLAREAAPTEFEVPVIAARNAGLPADQLADLDRAKLVALRVRNRLERRRDRAARAADAHDRMTALAFRGAGVEEVGAVVTDVLGGALLVLDEQGRHLATVGTLDRPDPAALTEALAASRSEGSSVRRGDLWVTAVVAGAENLGALVFRPDRQLVDADRHILELAALVTALLRLLRRTEAEAEGRVRGELLDDLIARPVRDADAMRARAKRLGVDLDAPNVVIAIDDEGGPVRQRAISWAQAYAAARGGLAVTRDCRVVLMLPGTAPGAVARTAARELRELLDRPMTAGAGGPVDAPGAIAAAYRDADRCVIALAALGRIGDGASTDELGFVGLLLGSCHVNSDRDVSAFLGSSIGPVVEYDARRGTALIKTLEAYFGVGGSLARAAEQLHVHVNTVTQRLERIGQLLGGDWQKPDRALEVQLALRLHRLRDREDTEER